MPSSTYTNGHAAIVPLPTKKVFQSQQIPSSEQQLLPTCSVPSKYLTQPSSLGVNLIGYSGGQPRPGTDFGPAALLSAGILSQLTDELGYTLHGDSTTRNYNSYRPSSLPAADAKEPLPSYTRGHRGMKNAHQVSAVTQQIAESVYQHASEGRMVLTLGGDHSIGIGTVGGVAKAIRHRFPQNTPDLAVIWVDAHADLNTPETSESGNIHGMPLAFSTGLTSSSEPGIFDWLSEEYLVNPAKLVYIGLRDIDRGEKRLLREHNIKAFSMHDVDRHGIGRVMDMALEYIGSECPIHLSFDVDALDPMWAPSTGTPVRGGLTLREGDFICEAIAESGQLVAVDLVEVNPQLVEGGVSDTVRTGISLVRCALGDTLL